MTTSTQDAGFDSSEASSSSAAGNSSAAGKPQYWRSLSEFRQDDSFVNDFLHREFPVAASEFPEGVSRRRWMQIMGASLAMAGAAGCRYPEELIAPFVLRPADRVPGEQYQAATNFELAGEVQHLLITCVDGRPIKAEPNTTHPTGSGAGTFAQACVLGLYDPDRTRGEVGVPIQYDNTEKRRIESDWDSFFNYGQALLRSVGDGETVAVMMSPTTSPTTLRMIGELQKTLPAASVCVYDPIDGGLMNEATQRVFGKPATQKFDFTEAEVIVSFQSDFLGTDAGSQNNARTFAARRDPMREETKGEMSRLYVAEGGYTTTGAAADVRIAIRPSQMKAVLAELGRRVEKVNSGETLVGEQYDMENLPGEGAAYNEIDVAARLDRFLNAAAADLAAAGDKGVVVVGETLGVDAVVAGIDMNSKLGSLSSIQTFRPVAGADLKNQLTLKEMFDGMTQGRLSTVLFLDTNLVHTAPGDLDFTKALERVEHSVYLGIYDDETAEMCSWSLPMSHPLESWGDCVGIDGHYGVCQPQILPLLGGRSAAEVMALMLDQEVTDAEMLVRRTADSVSGSAISDRQWRKLLHDGFSEDVIVTAEEVSAGDRSVELPGELPEITLDIDQDDIEVIFTASEALYDGRFANNAWLQEMPQSLTKLVWDNAAVMSPRTAEALGIKHGLMVAIRRGDTSVELPVYEMPGCAPGVITTQIGYGRTRVGAVGGSTEMEVDSVGVNVSPVRFTDSMLYAHPVEARPRYNEYELVTTQDHWAIDELGRDEAETRSHILIREGTLELLKKLPEFAEAKGPHVPSVGEEGSLWKEPINTIEERIEQIPQWGMSIDLTKCLGCNGCVIACQSENNVPIVGKEQVGNSREMHWLRIDRYFQGDPDVADVVQEPVACMHCETAPCEQVCPVAATVHTEEGLNAMTYNRCIGTRYCGNNCPYKVRRFNYFNYNKAVGVGYGIDAYPDSIENANRKLQQLVLNPDVTVRGRGVMEKCTYCVQRIEHAKIDARKDGGRPVRDGEIVTACQAACPTNAIEFGNVGDPDSAVSKAKADLRSYGMLTQLNVKPRTTYKARIRNTPFALMTRRQIEDLSLEAPHHGHDEHGEHGHDEHEHDEHEHDEHAHDEHAHGDEEHTRNLARPFQLPIV